MKEVAQALLKLGDPSGRQDVEYWDDWFNTVCCDDNHRSFEWYTDPEQVIRVLSYHLKDLLLREETRTATTATRRMIHPGSGTSLLPLALTEVYPSHSHVVVEVSPVAVEEMRTIHEKEFLLRKNTLQRCPIDYIVADLLVPSPLKDLAPSSFEAWIDKGFIDAVFSDKDQERNRAQAKCLFDEAHRLLQDDGILLIVTLAEQHSLALILENWLACDLQGSALWSSLHLWEMEPVSGDMLPFGCVLMKASSTSSSRHIVGHTLVGTLANIAAGDIAESLFYDAVNDHVLKARQQYAKGAREGAKRYLLATLDVKPYDAETDLVALGDLIRKTNWQLDGENGGQTLNPTWQAFPAAGDEMHEIVPIGFGISKLRLRCIVHADELDHLVAAIEEWEGDECVCDGVQSVDIDWDESIPIADASALRRTQR